MVSVEMAEEAETFDTSDCYNIFTTLKTHNIRLSSGKKLYRCRYSHR